MKNLLGKAQIISVEAFKKVTEITEKGLDKAVEFFETKGGVMDLKLRIARCEAELEQLYTQYGKLVFFNDTNDNEQEISKVDDIISERLSNLELLKAELEELQPPKKEEKTTVFCTKCGNELESDDVFCNKCGKELKK